MHPKWKESIQKHGTIRYREGERKKNDAVCREIKIKLLKQTKGKKMEPGNDARTQHPTQTHL